MAPRVPEGPFSQASAGPKNATQVASNLWNQSSLAQKQRLQQVFFPDGVRFDEKKLVGTGATLPVLNYLNLFRWAKKH